MAASQNLVLKVAGLHTNNNYYGAPAGSLAEAVNVVCDRTDILEPRRGLGQYGNTDAYQTKQLLNYKDVIIKHYSTKLSYDFDGLGKFIDLTGESVTEVETGVRLKYVEMNGNLYFATASGVKKISARTVSDFSTVTIDKAGAIGAVDISVTANYSSFGFLEPNSSVAYRIVFGKKDINDNLLLGSPSARTIVQNGGIVGVSTSITALITSGIDTTYFYQIYRTGLSTELNLALNPADPGDEMNLVIENKILAADITNGYISTADITSEAFRRNGPALYINPVSGEGVIQSNRPPPFCKDMTRYKDFIFYVNTSSVQRLNLSFLTINGITSGTHTFTVTNGVATKTYTFNGAFETETFNYSLTAVADYYNGTANQPSKYFTLVSASNERKYAVWFKRNAANDLAPVVAGFINIEVNITDAGLTTQNQFMTTAVTAINATTTDFNLSLNTSTQILTAECSNNGVVSTATVFTVTGGTRSSNGVGSGDAGTLNVFLPRTSGANAPDVGSALEQVAKSLIKKINANDTLVNGYYISSSSEIPGQIYLENRLQTGPAFWVNTTAPAVPPTAIFNPVVLSTGSAVISTNEVRPNRAFFSKSQQPESVPLVNFLDIGPKDRSIKRVLGLRDSLFFLKEDGIYRLSGDNPSNFTISIFDSSVQILAPDTAVVLNNQIYALSTQGVVVITDTGVSIISRPIEDQILDISRSITAYKTASFGVAYESDRSYLLWTVRKSYDTVATQCFRYNTFTNTWTKSYGIKTCGLVSFSDNKLYMGAGDFNFIEKERKDVQKSDHCDREYLKQLEAIGDKMLFLNNFDNLSEGDLLQQRQYLTAQQFNRTLRKLDLETGSSVNDMDYYSTLVIGTGSNPRTALVSLAAKLVTDITGSAVSYSSLIDTYTNTITGISVAEQTVITLGTHSIQSGRYVTITGSNCTPSIDGTHKIIAASATEITINVKVTTAGSAGTVVTDVNNFKDMQACFNLIIAGLNGDALVQFSDYLDSQGYIDLEEIVTTFNIMTNTVDAKYNQSFFIGEITLYKAIETIITYNPQFFQDPSVEKQVRQFSALYENTNFSKFIVGFKTDKSTLESQVSLYRGGIGDFGQFAWGDVSFGGVNAPTPLLTLVPLEKQRCRFMHVVLRHKVAQESYSLLGIALTYRPYGIKVNK